MQVVTFIRTYIEEHGLCHTVPLRGRQETPPVYLPRYDTKSTLHALYFSSLEGGNVHKVKRSSYNTIWQRLAHFVKARPRHNVCPVCNRHRKNVSDAVTDREKLQALESMREHVMRAEKERRFYTQLVSESKARLDKKHFTFDFAKNVLLPHHARQMGPLYSLSLKKVNVFGLRSDGEKRQLIYLYDESQTMGIDGSLCHGPDNVISMIHHGLERLKSGESCTFHADNAPGQNKNRYVIAYFLWRTMTGLNHSISLHMQVPGHTRCLVDDGFADFKRVYRRCDSDTLGDIARHVDSSSKANTAILYPEWAWNNWKPFLGQHFKALKGISTFHHFRVTKEVPGTVFVKRQIEDEEQAFTLLKDEGYVFTADQMPEQCHAPGLSRPRQEYLYRQVRPFVRPGLQDVTFPVP